MDWHLETDYAAAMESSQAKARPGGAAKRKNDRRDAIVTHAAELFALQGFERTTMNDIGAGMNLGAPALYYYFESKDELLFACICRSMDKLNTALGKADEIWSQGSIQEHLTALMHAQIIEEFRVENHMPLVNNYLYGAMRSVPRFTQENIEIMRILQRKTLDFYRNAIRSGVQRGEIVCDEITAVSFAILGIVQYLPTWIKNNRHKSAKKLAELHTHMLLDGLRVRD